MTAHEGDADPDDDWIPAWQDRDTDGDGLPDANPDCSMKRFLTQVGTTLDMDGDGTPELPYVETDVGEYHDHGEDPKVTAALARSGALRVVSTEALAVDPPLLAGRQADGAGRPPTHQRPKAQQDRP